MLRLTDLRASYADGRDEAIGFGALASWAARFAQYLISLGITPGERVAIMLEPSLAFYAALFGPMKAGAVAVPPSCRWTKPAARSCMRSGEPKAGARTIASKRFDTAPHVGCWVVRSPYFIPSSFNPSGSRKNTA